MSIVLVDLLRAGIPNLQAHIENAKKYNLKEKIRLSRARFGVAVVVAINHFTSDTEVPKSFVGDECRCRKKWHWCATWLSKRFAEVLFDMGVRV